ncbi:MAG: SurA N-terminal domain-containing protein [Bacteroidales bacterium]|nr:SurA N-terminal domain-containing protein [Bacteroidales bacterium]
MAILEKLRVKAGMLVAIVIGLALLAFVLSDLLDSGGSLFTRSKYEIAEVFGKSIPYTDYDNRVKQLEQIQKLQTGQLSIDQEVMDQLRTAAWESMIQDLLLDKQYAKLGIEVSQEELSDLIMGAQPHPYIQQLFTDPQTGIFNRQAFVMFMQQIESVDEMIDEKIYYLFLENEIFRERRYEKYLNIIRQGLYATELEASKNAELASKTVDVDYLVRNFSTVQDAEINISDKEIRKYYREHKNNYGQEESRDITFIIYQVVPSPEDYEDAENWINDIKEDFDSAEDIEHFITMESDVPYDATNYSYGELPDTLNDFMFAAEPGATLGPYYEEDAYKISRLAEINYLPDSVRARHILLQVTESNVSMIFEMADSLKNLIENGVDFSLLAMTNSVDNSAQSGGDLGWFREGDMVRSFSDSCFFGNEGDIKIVPTEYGLHVVEILDQSRSVKKVQVGTLVKKVEASEATDQRYYIQANEFAGLNNTHEKFIQAAEEESFTGQLQTALNLGPMDKSVPGIASARQLVSWAYQAEMHEVSNVFKIDDKYVIATVDEIREEGFVPLQDIRLEIENEVKKQKKAEVLIAQFTQNIGKATSLESLADDQGLQLQTASKITYNSSTFGSAGVEPRLVGAALALEQDRISIPITGENGVYIMVVNNISRDVSDVSQTIEQLRGYIEQDYSALTTYYAYDALMELADIEDSRREFF